MKERIARFSVKENISGKRRLEGIHTRRRKMIDSTSTVRRGELGI